MKKKIFLTIVMTMMLALVLAFAVSAESVHNGKVDLNATVTLDNGTVVNLFDTEGNALIWYMNGTTLESIRADDQRVKYKATYGFNVGNDTVGKVYAYEVSDMWIALESGNINRGNIVVLNLMDDDVLVNEATNNSYMGGVVNCVKTIAWANKVLEYAYLRLDTAAIQQQAFNGCPKLKYINLENLTELRQIGGAQSISQTAGQSVLFAGQTLDLTKTKLITLGGDGIFNNVPFVDVKFPSTLTNINSWCLQGTALVSFAFPTGVATINGSQFNDTKSLKEIYINSTTTKINERAFNNTALEKVFYVGTLTQLTALLDNTNATNNAPLMAVIGDNRANLISYENYMKLEDKSGKYVVYDFPYCDAYNNGVHELDPAQSNPCAGICGVCGSSSLAANPVHNYVTTIKYENYLANGVKTQACQNEGCTHKATPVVTEVAPIISEFKGFSVSEKGDAITFGYVINYDALDEFVKVTGKSAELGFVIAVKAFAGEDTYTSDKAIKASVVTWTNDDEANSDTVRYTGADFVLRGNWDREVEVGGEEIDVKKVEFYMAGYMLVNGEVVYLNANGSSNAAGVVTFEKASTPEVAE